MIRRGDPECDVRLLQVEQRSTASIGSSRMLSGYRKRSSLACVLRSPAATRGSARDLGDHPRFDVDRQRPEAQGAAAWDRRLQHPDIAEDVPDGSEEPADLIGAERLSGRAAVRAASVMLVIMVGSN